MNRPAIESALNNHICDGCQTWMSTFEYVDQDSLLEKANQSHLAAVNKNNARDPQKYKERNLATVQKSNAKDPEKHKQQHAKTMARKRSKTKFPPSPPSTKLQHTIISDWCKDMSPNSFMESGCAVCGELTALSQLQTLSSIEDIDLDLLIQESVTRKERHSSSDPIEDLDEQVLEHKFDDICNKCYKSMAKGKRPLLALANGKWLGEVSTELSDLSYAEQLLIARIRHNRCIVRVSSGMHKMRANAVTFANPTPKIYDKLPPHSSELDEVLAFIYTGPCKPTKSDFERTPLLVRRKQVANALNWLILNHADYYNVEISAENLQSYPDDEIPVVVDYRHATTNKDPESTAVNDMDLEDGTESGPCPFVVHGLTGEQYSSKSTKALKAIALKHLHSNGGILGIGHEKDPQSIYSNPQLYPQMMPWLFPYGLGGIGNDLQQGRLSDIAHKRHFTSS
jgi:hypothetical protein